MSITKELVYQNLIDNENTIKQLKIIENDHNKMYLIHKALKNQLTNNRVRKANTKTRSEVRGGGKKPWKQKGTGRARAGSSRSPLWKGGGVTFGPRKKSYKSKINKKEKRLAINTLIHNKFNQTIIVNQILNNLNTPSTKTALSEIKELGIQIKSQRQLLIIVHQKTKTLYLSLRNINNLELIEVNSLNIISLLKADTIIMTKKALETITY
uniref:Large ribosomal subunit protein uL4c n=1 Tax=Polysiphonia sp. TaxID=1967842 RepID=A0A1Z1MUK6_9FLOR|nr:ribosomal protein L4 [Polysiphonia sp.]